MIDFDYIPISVATLVPRTNVGLDLYRLDNDSSRYVLYRGRDYPLVDEDLDRLRGRGIQRLFITAQSRDDYQSYLRELTAGEHADAPFSARVGAMSEVVRETLATSFDSGETDEAVRAAIEMGAMTAEIVANDQFAAEDLFRVLHHDYATFTHSANVAFYTAMLAKELGYPEREVERITVGGLLHDLGKLGIDDRILAKPGKLDEDEFDRIRMHPTLGLRQISRRSDLCDGQLMMVYQHHERLDGGGYPVGLSEDEIHPWARLCSVVDVFEALTSNRPYRSPLTNGRAIELQSEESGTAFDPEILSCWTSIIQQRCID